MGVYRYVGGLASLLFVILLHFSAAAPTDTQTQVRNPFPPKFPGCPMYQVGPTSPVVKLTLHETLYVAVKPNFPMLIMDIVISEQHRYKATMDASRIVLDQCNMDYTECKTLKEEASKSSDFFNANKWNYVNVSFVEDKITVTVNMRKNGMGSVMQSGDQRGSSVKLSILGYSEQTNHTLPSSYAVDVNVFCNETVTPTMETMPENSSITEDPTKTSPAPFPDCSIYEVGQNSPRQTEKFEDAITLAVFPSQPALDMDIMVQEDLYKVSVDGTMTKLEKCNKDGNNCDIMTEGGAKDSTMFRANRWNIINILLTDSEITVQVNAKHEIMNKLMVVQPDAEYAEVVILPHGTSNSSSQSSNSDYSVTVNRNCSDAVDATTIPTTIADVDIATTEGTAGDKGKVVDEKDGGVPEEPNDNKTLIIVLAVLAICLVILIIGLAWHCCKSKRSVDINQHTPLEEQYQQN